MTPLTETERAQLGRVLTTPDTLVGVTDGGPLARVVEQIIAERIAAAAADWKLTESVLRGEIRRTESAIAKYDELVEDRDEWKADVDKVSALYMRTRERLNAVLAGIEALAEAMVHPDSWASLTEDSFPWVVERLRTIEATDSTGHARVIDAAHLERQRQWSRATFGPGRRTVGVLQHIRKELGEIEEAPTDVREWIDVAILALDGAWRTGAEPQQIIDALIAKQERNEARTWPDWRTMSEDQAIEHVRNNGDVWASHGHAGVPCSPPEAVRGEAVCRMKPEAGGSGE